MVIPHLSVVLVDGKKLTHGCTAIFSILNNVADITKQFYKAGRWVKMVF